MSEEKALIFDFDGTLVDSLPLYLDILYRGRTSSRSTITDEQLTFLRTAPLLRLVGNLDVPPFSRMRLLWTRWRHLHRRIGEASSFGDLREVLIGLHKQGHKLFVLSSNYERNVHAFLRAHKLDHYFVGVYHTNIFLKARGLKKLVQAEGLDKHAAYYIGNEPLDIQAAHKAGIRSIAALWSGQETHAIAAEHPTHSASKPGDLLKLFKA